MTEKDEKPIDSEKRNTSTQIHPERLVGAHHALALIHANTNTRPTACGATP